MFTCSKQWKHEFVKFLERCEICMKTNVLNMKVNNKGTRLMHVTLFRGMGIEDPVKHLQWNFFKEK